VQTSSTMAATAPTPLPLRPNPFGHHPVESVVPRVSAITQAVTVAVTATTVVTAAMATAKVTTSCTANPTRRSPPVTIMQHMHWRLLPPLNRDMPHKGRSLRRTSEKLQHDISHEGIPARIALPLPLLLFLQSLLCLLQKRVMKLSDPFRTMLINKSVILYKLALAE
jgi:hypothetical protein